MVLLPPRRSCTSRWRGSCSDIDEERGTPCILRWLAVVLQAMARGSCGIEVMICAYINVCGYHVYTQSDITFSTHLTVAMLSYRISSGMTSTMNCWNDDDGSVCSQSLLLVTGHHWEELACEELVKYVRERAFDAEVSSCKTTNSCKESVKICDDGGRRSSAYTIDMNRRSIELVTTITVYYSNVVIDRRRRIDRIEGRASCSGRGAANSKSRRLWLWLL